MPFKKFGLLDELVQGILATGYTAPTEIQSQAIPAAIEGKDLIASAQTGTGKTAAFVLPMLNRLGREPVTKKKRIKALIITPTRELAVQIEQAIRGYGRFLKLFVLSVYGGTNIDMQIKDLKRGADIIVATPGRLMDHMQRRTINLSQIKMLVLDEADRMLDMGFINDIHKITESLPKERQTLLFSATMPDKIKKLSANIMKKPKRIQIGTGQSPIETITQYIYPVAKRQKMELLLHLLNKNSMYSVLVFSRTKYGADKIRRKLVQEKIKAVAIHSDRTQRQRLNALNGFKRGKYHVMVATDIAARGIDVEGISHVINYDVPTHSEDYVHRIGRTGRAASTGDAITFVSQDEVDYLRRIERFIERTFKPSVVTDFSYTEIVNLNKKSQVKKSGRPRIGSSQRRRRKAQQEKKAQAKKQQAKRTKKTTKKKPATKFNTKKKKTTKRSSSRKRK